MLKYLFLYPLAVIYSIITSIRNRLFNIGLLKSVEFDIPVISIGNLTLGGTGKTPHTEYLIHLFKQNSNKVAVLSRGYKRKTNDFRFAKASSTVEEIGDEPLQIKQKFPTVPVAVDKKRVRGANEILKQTNGLNVILLDDAYQHRYIKPGLSILLTDYNKPYYEDKIIPLGRLRESSAEMDRANIIIVTKTPPDIKPIEKRIVIKKIKPYPYQNVYFTTLKYGHLIPIQEYIKKTAFQIDLNDKFANGKYNILLVTGIANPEPLKHHLEKFSENIEHINFRDHYQFKVKDIRQIEAHYKKMSIDKTIIITTEKDAIRLKNAVKKNKSIEVDLPFYYLPIEIEFLENTKNEFDNHIIEYVRKNKSFDGFFDQSI